MKRVLILGGYGNFGRFISTALAKEPEIQLIIAGRSIDKARQLTKELNAVNRIECMAIDIHASNFAQCLADSNPDIVIHTSGPFQAQDYIVAKACITKGCHYIDLADGREFVENFTALDSLAKAKNVLLISGASSVPCLTAALVEHYRHEFETLESINYGITTAQKTTRGLATTAAILGYTGKPFKSLINGKHQDIYGWQGLHARRYKGLGWRLLGYCNVPDLALFPRYYLELKDIRFYAGLELPFIHITLWLLSWLVRIGLIRNLQRAAPLLLRLSFLFDWLGSANSGFHMTLVGQDTLKQPKSITFELIARSGDGPYIPCMPAILMAKKLAKDELHSAGAYPCIGFISRDEYLEALSSLDISWEDC
ncbi:MAG: saccharopine dehydrogenase NADP-binding domain-containing protein [Pseudomonadota bacterium]